MVMRDGQVKSARYETKNTRDQNLSSSHVETVDPANNVVGLMNNLKFLLGLPW